MYCWIILNHFHFLLVQDMDSLQQQNGFIIQVSIATKIMKQAKEDYIARKFRPLFSSIIALWLTVAITSQLCINVVKYKI